MISINDTVKLYRLFIQTSLSAEALDCDSDNLYDEGRLYMVDEIIDTFHLKGEYEHICKLFTDYISKGLNGEDMIFPEDITEGMSNEEWRDLLTPWITNFRTGKGKDGVYAYRLIPFKETE